MKSFILALALFAASFGTVADQLVCTDNLPPHQTFTATFTRSGNVGVATVGTSQFSFVLDTAHSVPDGVQEWKSVSEEITLRYLYVFDRHIWNVIIGPVYYATSALDAFSHSNNIRFVCFS